MLDIAKILAGAGLVWAAVTLVFQVIRARGGGRTDFSDSKGNPRRGIAYYFTVAMIPTHKESASKHPLEFSIGMLMHVGVIASLVTVLLFLVRTDAVGGFLLFARPVILLALIAGLLLLVRRTRSKSLRAMTSPDDFIAIIATCGLLALASLADLGPGLAIAFLLYTAVLCVYVPLGKLRHAIFFFAARAEYGRRLGHRGVYPPPAAKGQPDAGQS